MQAKSVLGRIIMQVSRTSRRAAIAGFSAIAAIGLAHMTPASAQDYPTKPITMIIPWPAGGSSDVSMRAIAEAASKRLASHS